MEKMQVVLHRFKFRQKSWGHHIGMILASPKEIFLVAVSALGVFWTVCEMTGSDGLAGRKAFTIAVLLSLLIGLALRSFRYLREVPEGFELSSRKAQYLAHIQPKYWEHKLAQILIAERIAPLEFRLTRIEKGFEFIRARDIGTYRDLEVWLNLRVLDAGRLVKVAGKLLTEEMPDAIAGKGRVAPVPVEILQAVDGIENLYRDLVSFEISAREPEFPDELQALSLTLIDWTSTIRELLADQLMVMQRRMESAKRGEELGDTFIKVLVPINLRAFKTEKKRLVPLFKEKCSTGRRLL